MTFFKTFLASTLGALIAFLLTFGISLFVIIGIIATAAKDITNVSESSSSNKLDVKDQKNRIILDIDFPSKIDEYSEGIVFSKTKSLTFLDWIQKLKYASKDTRISGIWLKPCGFAGSWAQAEELREQLVNFKKNKKFIYSSGMNYDEKAYFLASIADSVLIDPAGQFEINGIYSTLEFYKPLLDKLGVNAQVTRAGKFKSAVEPFLLNQASEESKFVVNNLISQIFTRFTNTISSARDIPDYQLNEIINNNSLLTPNEAKEFNFIDGIKYQDEIIDMFKNKLKIPIKIKIIDDNDNGNLKGLNLLKLNDYDVEIDNEDLENKIALIYVQGNIQSGKNGYNPNPIFGGNGVGSSSFIESLKSARDNKKVKAIIIRIDSPGGSAQASDNMWREIELTEKIKPIVISMGSVAASGGYYIASAGEWIIADSSTITGSIGVFSLSFNAKRFFSEKLGINTETIKTNPNADIMLPTNDLTVQQQFILSKNVDSIYSKFLDVVSIGRKISKDSVNSIAQGRVWTGIEAKEVGLVDEIGGLDYAIQVTAKRSNLKGYSLLILPKQKSFFDKINDAIDNTEESVLSFIHNKNSTQEYKDLFEEMMKSSGVQARMNNILIQ